MGGSSFLEIDGLAENSRSLTKQCLYFRTVASIQEDMWSNVSRIRHVSQRKSDTVYANKQRHKLFGSTQNMQLALQSHVLHPQIEPSEDHNIYSDCVCAK